MNHEWRRVRLSKAIAATRGILSVFAIWCVAGCAPGGSLPHLSGPDGTLIEFHTQEVTAPFFEIDSEDGGIYFDLLGEIYRIPKAGGVAELIPLGGGFKRRPMLSPDGRFIAFTSDRNGTVGLWLAPFSDLGRSVELTVPTDDHVTSAAWISNRTILVQSRATTHHTANSAFAITVTSDGTRAARSPAVAGSALRSMSALSSDRERFVYYWMNGEIARLDLTTGLVETLVDKSVGATEPRLANSGSILGFVAVHEGVRTLHTMELESRQITVTSCQTQQSVDWISDLEPSFAFDQHDTSVVTTRGGEPVRCKLDGTLSILPFSAQVRFRRAPVARPQQFDPADYVPPPRFIASGPKAHIVAFTSQEHVWVFDERTASVSRLTNADGQEYSPSISADATRIAYINVTPDGVSELRVRTLSDATDQTILTSVNILQNPSWSPDGGALAYVEGAYNGDQIGDADVLVKWVSLSGETGTFGDTIRRGVTHRDYPTVQWSVDGLGVYFMRAEPRGLRVTLRYHDRSGQGSEVLRFDGRVWDLTVSPSNRFVAVQSQLELRILPFLPNAKYPVGIDQDSLESVEPIATSGIDYVAWAGDDTILWTSKDKLFRSAGFGRPELLGSLATPRPPVLSAGRRAYIGATIYTMNGAPISDGLLVTSGSQIEYVGPRLSLEGFREADVIDVSGEWILPGLIDTHQHGRLGDVETTTSFNQRMFASLAFGVTTVFDPQITTIDGAVLSEASQRDDFLGPTFYSTGRAILGDIGQEATYEIANFDDVIDIVEFHRRAGTPMIKAYTRASPQERRWLAEAARQRGIGVTADERYSLVADLGVLAAGYSAFEHGFREVAYDDVRQLLIQSQIAMTPTLVDAVAGEKEYMFRWYGPSFRFDCLATQADQTALQHPPWSGTDHDALATIMGGWNGQQAVAFADMLNRGASVSIGSHKVMPGLATHLEMGFLELAGARPEAVLRAATVNGARKLGLEERVGMLKPDMDADFVILGSDPMLTVRNLRDISHVVRRGRQVSWPVRSPPPGWQSRRPWAECQSWNFGTP